MKLPTLSASQESLLKLLQSKYTVTRYGNFWTIDGRMTYWPETGKYKFSLSCGGKGGTLRGSPDSNAEQLFRLMAPHPEVAPFERSA